MNHFNDLLIIQIMHMYSKKILLGVRYSVCLVLIFSTEIYAESEAQSAALPLKRLFFTAEERRSLEKGPSEEVHVPKSNEDKSIKEIPMLISGHVSRNDGKQTLWINGRPVNEVPAWISLDQMSVPGKLFLVDPEKKIKQVIFVGDIVKIHQK